MKPKTQTKKPTTVSKKVGGAAKSPPRSSARMNVKKALEFYILAYRSDDGVEIESLNGGAAGEGATLEDAVHNYARNQADHVENMITVVGLLDGISYLAKEIRPTLRDWYNARKVGEVDENGRTLIGKGKVAFDVHLAIEMPTSVKTAKERGKRGRWPTPKQDGSAQDLVFEPVDCIA